MEYCGRTRKYPDSNSPSRPQDMGYCLTHTTRVVFKEGKRRGSPTLPASPETRRVVECHGNPKTSPLSRLVRSRARLNSKRPKSYLFFLTYIVLSPRFSPPIVNGIRLIKAHTFEFEIGNTSCRASVRTLLLVGHEPNNPFLSCLICSSTCFSKKNHGDASTLCKAPSCRLGAFRGI